MTNRNGFAKRIQFVRPISPVVPLYQILNMPTQKSKKAAPKSTKNKKSVKINPQPTKYYEYCAGPGKYKSIRNFHYYTDPPGSNKESYLITSANREKAYKELNYSLSKQSKVTVQIANNKTKSKPTPVSPSKGLAGRIQLKGFSQGQPQSQAEATSGEASGGPTNTDSSEFAVVDIGQDAGDPSLHIPPDQDESQDPPKKTSDTIFDKISEKASKLFPKRPSFGKLFGDKHNTSESSEVRIYTIDKEMRANKSGTKEKKSEEITSAFSKSELVDKLQRSKPVPVILQQEPGKAQAIQASPFPPFRLHFLPASGWRDSDHKVLSVLKVLLCQCGLAVLILILVLFGALLIHLAEAPHELFESQKLAVEQKTLVISLATDLRMVAADEPVWKQTIQRYSEKQHRLSVQAIREGYTHEGSFWTYPGSVLYVASLFTMLGFGAPVPFTIVGRIGAFLLAVVGFPIHFLFALNVGRLIAIKLQLLSHDLEAKFKEVKRRVKNVRKYGEDMRKPKEVWPEEMFLKDFRPPIWLRLFPFVAIPIYYLTGMILFGWIRGKNSSDLILYPVDFTSTGELATTYGLTRIAYAFFLEGAAILVAIIWTVLSVPRVKNLTSTVINLGLMTNSLE